MIQSDLKQRRQTITIKKYPHSSLEPGLAVGKKANKNWRTKQAEREQIKHCVLQQKGTGVKNFTICFKEDKSQNFKKYHPSS